LEDFGSAKRGFVVRGQHFSYPRNKTTIPDLIKKVFRKKTADVGVMR